MLILLKRSNQKCAKCDPIFWALENVNWTVDKYVALSQTGHGNGRANGKSASPNGKSPAAKISAPKKTTPAKKATSSPKRKAPAKSSSTKGKTATKSKTPKKKSKK